MGRLKAALGLTLLLALPACGGAPRPVEQASVDLVACVLDGAALDDATYAPLASRLGVPPMIEVIALVGYYRTLADLMQVFDVGVPSDA